MLTIRISKPVLLLVLILAMVTCVYANHFHNGFHFDDYHTILDNPYIRNLHNLPRFFADGSTFSVLPANQTYRPVVSSVLAIDYVLGRGYNPFWFQMSGYVVFLLQLVAMYVLFTAVLNAVRPESESGAVKNPYIALAAVAWYGLHPAMAETVNYIIQCGDIFSTFGVVAALALYACLPEWRKTHLYLLPFVFGMLSKPPAMVFPVLLFLYIAMFEEKGEGHFLRALRASRPAITACILLIVFQMAMTPKSFARTHVPSYSYWITQPFVLLRYFASFFLPVHLNVDTDLRAFDSLTANAFWGFSFLILLLMLIWLTARRQVLHPIAFGFSWFLVASLPTSLFPLSEVENDHRMFMPFVGLVLSVTWSLVLLAERSTALRRDRVFRITGYAAACIALIIYAWGTHVRDHVWSSEDLLWLDDVQKCPQNGRGLMVYGLDQLNKGNLNSALDYLLQAQHYTPNYVNLEVNLGVVLAAMHRPIEAEPHFMRAVSLEPLNDQSYFYYARWLVQEGRLEEGLQQALTAYRLNPSRLETDYLLMNTYGLLGNGPAASQVARSVLSISPGDDTAKQFLSHPPTASEPYYWFDVALQQCRNQNLKQCVADAQLALKQRPDFPEAWNLIAAAYEHMRDFDNSIAAAREALRLKPDYEAAQTNLALSEREKNSAH